MSNFQDDLREALHLMNTEETGGCNCDPEVNHQCETCFIHGVLWELKQRLAAAEALLREACELWDGDNSCELTWGEWIERAKEVVG